MKMQVAVRTYASDYGVKDLNKYLDEGYLVVMCNQTYYNGHIILEYILEKEVKDNEKD